MATTGHPEVPFAARSIMTEPFTPERRQDFDLRRLVDRVLAETSTRDGAPRIRRATMLKLPDARHRRSPIRLRGYLLGGTCTRS